MQRNENDLLIFNSSFLLTMGEDGTGKTIKGPAGALPAGAVLIRDGEIHAVGSSDHLLSAFPRAERCDAQGRIVMPGFVDCHTHLVFAGERSNEYHMRLSGKTYLEILNQGGGIHSTVKKTREASSRELFERGYRFLDIALQQGTTTIEIKSGYGLEEASELKQLDVINSLGHSHELDTVATFLGAHTFPKDLSRSEYLQWLYGPALESAMHHTDFVDAFVEEGAFTSSEIEEYFKKALSLGFKLRIHAGQFSDQGAVKMAAELGALSADHLEEVSEDQIKTMAIHGTRAVFLPGAAYFLKTAFPDTRAFTEQGVIPAIASDFNPGSSPSLSIPFMIHLAVHQCGMDSELALYAATMGGASVIGREDQVGSLKAGKQADILILNIEKPEELPYYYANNPVAAVFKKGRLIWDSRRDPALET
jgi:imidazolonepropionase